MSETQVTAKEQLLEQIDFLDSTNYVLSVSGFSAEEANELYQLNPRLGYFFEPLLFSELRKRGDEATLQIRINGEPTEEQVVFISRMLQLLGKL